MNARLVRGVKRALEIVWTAGACLWLIYGIEVEALRYTSVALFWIVVAVGSLWVASWVVWYLLPKMRA